MSLNLETIRIVYHPKGSQKLYPDRTYSIKEIRYDWDHDSPTIIKK